MEIIVIQVCFLLGLVLMLMAVMAFCLIVIVKSPYKEKVKPDIKDKSKLPSQVTHQELTDMFNKIKDEHGNDAAFTFIENFGKQSFREVEIRLRNLGAKL
jgi:hypothetical protein